MVAPPRVERRGGRLRDECGGEVEAVGGVKVVGGVAGGGSLVARRGWDAARVDAVHPHS